MTARALPHPLAGLRDRVPAFDRWRFTVDGKAVGILPALPRETSEQARRRFLKAAPFYQHQDLVAEGIR